MSITRQDRQKLVLDLYYNQDKTILDIAKEARISFRDIGSILNKADEVQRKEQEQQDRR
jgi:DNA-directed RNA polymerase specialized sigma subunit